MFRKLGKFDIQKVLGRGAMGEVYLGVDPAIGREVAIKTILDASAPGQEAKARFAREAKAAGVLNHPNLVTIYEFGEDQGVLYIAMEFVRGHDLEELFQEQSLTRAELLEILAQVCDGLDFAHRAGIVHRDIKPANVRVQKDGRRLTAKVMDFGVARVGNSDMTATGMVMGTVSYMAPEYIRTGQPDSRSDLFAVGVMLYEALSGRKPFAGDTTPTILYKIVNEPPGPIDPVQLQGISPAIKEVLERALCKDPDSRYQHADELSRALRAAKDPTWGGRMDESTIRVARAASPSAAVELPTPAKPSRSGRWIGLAALLLAGLGAGGYGVFRARPLPALPGVSSLPVQDEVKRPRPDPEEAPNAAPVKSEARPAVALLPPRRVEPQVAEIKKPAPEPRAIDQPQRYEPGNLEKLQAHERSNLGLLSMSESIQLVEKDPEKAIDGFRQALKADPSNANAYAWLAVIYFEQQRYGEFGQVLREARRAGVAAQMGRNARFLAAYRQAKFNQRLPSDLGD